MVHMHLYLKYRSPRQKISDKPREKNLLIFYPLNELPEKSPEKLSTKGKCN